MTLTKEDKKWLLRVLEDDHKKQNKISIKKCPVDDCLYKKIIKELKLK
jgi:hypothetical protein